MEDEVRYDNFIIELRNLCNKCGLAIGGGGNCNTGIFKFGTRPKVENDEEIRDYLPNYGIIISQKENNPAPEPYTNYRSPAQDMEEKSGPIN